VKYTTAAAFRQALEEHLKNDAASTGLALAYLRKRVAFELLLRRLLVVAPDRWVLKGALALNFRLAIATRSTKDIDLGRDDDEQAAIADITAAQQLAMNDYFTFAATRTDELEETDEFSAVRFHVTAQLAGRTFEHTRTYGQSHKPSTRPKDLVDILLIERSATIKADDLRHALQSTFAERARQPMPRVLGSWPLRTLGSSTSAPARRQEGSSTAAGYRSSSGPARSSGSLPRRP
jgi:hypothetical protein